MPNPYKIEGQPIVQFKSEADVWDDGYKEGRGELVKWLLDLDNYILDENKLLQLKFMIEILRKEVKNVRYKG